MSTVPPSPPTDAMHRRAPSDLWLWLVVILPTISAALAYYKLTAVVLLLIVFGLAALECGRFADAKFTPVVVRYLACAFVTAVLYVGSQFAINFIDKLVNSPPDNVYLKNDAQALWERIPIWTRIKIRSVSCVVCGLLLAAGLTREVRPSVQLGLCGVLALFVNPIFVAWMRSGWLAPTGYSFFNRGTLVYSLAGWSALAVLVVRGWLTHDDRKGPQYSLNQDRPWLCTGGALLLSSGLLCYLVLIAASSVDGLFYSVVSAAACGAIAASLVALALCRARWMQFAIVGVWATMAAVHSVPGTLIVVTFVDYLFIGMVAGSLSAISLWYVDELGIPDHLGVVSACGFGGATGTVGVGFLKVVPRTSHEATTLMMQLLATAAPLIWAFVVFGGITWGAMRFVQMRSQSRLRKSELAKMQRNTKRDLADLSLKLQGDRHQHGGVVDGTDGGGGPA
jgi:hypothetical protein